MSINLSVVLITHHLPLPLHHFWIFPRTPLWSIFNPCIKAHKDVKNYLFWVEGESSLWLTHEYINLTIVAENSTRTGL